MIQNFLFCTADRLDKVCDVNSPALLSSPFQAIRHSARVRHWLDNLYLQLYLFL